jgi:hypothetical protein
MALKFIPPKKIGRYAVYVESSYRNSSFRTHDTIGGAKQSLVHQAFNWRTGAHTNAKLLEMVNGEWYVLYDIPTGTKLDELPWKKKQYVDTSYGMNRYYNEKPTWGNKEYGEVYRTKPMDVEEYVQWRIAVHEESKNAKGTRDA